MYYPFVDNILMFRKKNTIINKLNFFQFLNLRYGLNNKLILIISQYSGYHYLLKIEKIQRSYLADRLINFFLKNLQFLDKKLKDTIYINIQKLIKINCYRGIRHIYGYPVRGQRTRTNAQTKKKLRV